VKTQFRWATVLLLLAALSSLMWASTATAETAHKGWGIVMSRDISKSTLEIGDRVYRITSRTVFKDRNGSPTTFETLEIFDVHQGLFSVDDATKVEYVSVETSRGPELQSVKVVAELPY
jgi:hypothetical protein